MCMDTNPDKNPRPVRSPHRAWMGLSVLALPALLVAMDLSVLLLAVPALSRDLERATLAPSSLSLIRGLFPDERRRQVAIGIWMSCFAGGAAVGPVVAVTLLRPASQHTSHRASDQHQHQ